MHGESGAPLPQLQCRILEAYLFHDFSRAQRTPSVNCEPDLQSPLTLKANTCFPGPAGIWPEKEAIRRRFWRSGKWPQYSEPCLSFHRITVSHNWPCSPVGEHQWERPGFKRRADPRRAALGRCDSLCAESEDGQGDNGMTSEWMRNSVSFPNQSDSADELCNWWTLSEFLENPQAYKDEEWMPLYGRHCQRQESEGGGREERKRGEWVSEGKGGERRRGGEERE